MFLVVLKVSCKSEKSLLENVIPVVFHLLFFYRVVSFNESNLHLLKSVAGFR